MKKLLFLLMLAAISCSKEDCREVAVQSLPDVNSVLFSIPIETALESLDEFMKGQGLVETKSSISDYVDNYFVVSPAGTKSACASDGLLYAVNFKKETGYALLAADSRIGEDILAVTDAGSVSESDFNKPSLVREPSSNDDLSESDYNDMVESGVLAGLVRPIDSECLRYARQKVDDNLYCGGGSGSISNSNVETFSWKVVKKVPRMLNTAWTQSTTNNDIFNKYCPEVGLIWKSIAPAGCVCIALSQIMAYHEFPPNLICDGLLIDYPAIKEIYSYDWIWARGNESSREILARYCKNVGACCHTKYHSIFGYTFGFAWPSDAKSCLEIFGYKNVSLNWRYDENQVLKSLDNGCPVFMSALADFFAGHAWVIDGYLKQEYVSNYGRVANSQTLVHCNWGWQGISNGYFTSGVFHTDEAVISDNLTTQEADHHYWIGFNTITYENPWN